MERYEISDKIGEGTGGIVFLASIVTASKAAAEYGLQVGAFKQRCDACRGWGGRAGTLLPRPPGRAC